jgi:hypothetical protein
MAAFRGEAEAPMPIQCNEISEQAQEKRESLS